MNLIITECYAGICVYIGSRMPLESLSISLSTSPAYFSYTLTSILQHTVCCVLIHILCVSAITYSIRGYP